MWINKNVLCQVNVKVQCIVCFVLKEIKLAEILLYFAVYS